MVEMWRGLSRLERLNLCGLRGVVAACFTRVEPVVREEEEEEEITHPLPSLKELRVRSCGVSGRDVHRLLRFLRRPGFVLDVSDNWEMRPSFFEPVIADRLRRRRGAEKEGCTIIINDTERESRLGIPVEELRGIARVLSETGCLLESNLVRRAQSESASEPEEEEEEEDETTNLRRMTQFVLNFERDVLGEHGALPRPRSVGSCDLVDEGEEEADEAQWGGKTTSAGKPTTTWKRWVRNDIGLAGFTYCTCDCCLSRIETKLDEGVRLTYTKKEMTDLRWPRPSP